MRYAYTILYVEDVEASLTFYEKAFGFARKFITEEKDYGELVSGETTIAFASIELGQSNLRDGFNPIHPSTKAVGVEMAFTTTKIKADFQRCLDAGATEFEPLTEKPWGQTVGYVRDINGFLIEICTPMKMEE